MRRLLIRGEWFDCVNTTALYENEFESILISNAQYLVPAFHVCPFKIIVESDEGSAKADLAFVEKTYRQWIVVEVELGHHSFNGHVLPQARRLRLGVYGSRHADYLADNNAALDRGRLRDMVKGDQPSVIVLSNKGTAEWETELNRIDVDVYSFEIFKSDREQYVFETDLALSALAPATFTLCRRDRFIQSWLQVNSPGALPVLPNESMEVVVDGAITSWTRVDTQQGVYLKPEGRCPLSSQAGYELVRGTSGDLELRQSP